MTRNIALGLLPFDLDALRPLGGMPDRVITLCPGRSEVEAQDLGSGECQVFCVWVIGSMLPERSKGTMTISNELLDECLDTERYRVPIDPASETRKRDNLAARKAQLARPAAAAVDACKAAYPEDKG
ncbi:hypothetical protein DPM13_03230 [Paracoccus mutanolyticus]|uniref:Uncharacterized protein n=1 Tax=Paracoccus mutanolyticus TaxID=1499308 RepID=A0ABM6WPS2_9RHOB|nr:hypothetical protein [Paracoccus mutanolyticus]AWX92577.1 hypothetical protein DPM13_03230 [Paracoccus mutanolyticus]